MILGASIIDVPNIIFENLFEKQGENYGRIKSYHQ